jgi:hypothetical protein
MSAEKPVITTLTIGSDHIDSLQKCIESKLTYAVKNGYTFIEGGLKYPFC